MYVSATLSPPLGGSTVVTAGKPVRFVATLRVSGNTTRSVSDWRVGLWYGFDGDAEWHSLPFNPSPIKVHDATPHNGTVNYVYHLDLPTSDFTRPLKFTLRYRPDHRSDWIWAKDAAKLQDGELIFQSPDLTAGALTGLDFSSLFEHTDPLIVAKPVHSQVSGVDVFNVTAPCEAFVPSGIMPGAITKADWKTISLGNPTGLRQFYATVSRTASWMIPKQGPPPFKVNADAYVVGFLRSDGRHVVVLGVSSFNINTYLTSDDHGNIIIKSRNDSTEDLSHRVVIATGADWQRTSDAAFYGARDVARFEALEAGRLAEVDLEKKEEEPSPVPNWYESWYDGVGYCTWNGLGRELTEERILDALQDLHENKIYISTLIIDDNWQSLDDNYRWVRFEANENFPKGLRHTITEIRRSFPYIKHIAVWHSIFGYWDGIAPNGWIAENYETKRVKWHQGREVTVVSAKDVGRLYMDFYRFLANCGIDAIKCDVQSSLIQLDDSVDRRELGKAYQDAFKQAHLRYFSGRVIYCMAMRPAIYFHSLINNRGPKPLLRNSDDFFPDIPASHAWHVFTNAMNNMYTSHLNVIPDWDMFQTSLPAYGGIHAAARCVSGGPIYITDTPRAHDLDLLKSMTALSIRSPDRHLIIRPSNLALPVDPYIQYNSNRLLKSASYNGGWHGNSLLAVFNVSEEIENSDIVTLKDFKGIDSKEVYVVHSHKSGRVYVPIDENEELRISVNMPVAGWDVFSAIPLKHARIPTRVSNFVEEVNIAVLGLVGNISGAAAVESWSVRQLDNGRTEIRATVKALGTLGVFISSLPRLNLGDLMATMGDRGIPLECVEKGYKDERILGIDMEKAWKLLGLKAGWGNETSLKVYI